jgi:adenylyltransferase/sulfurtransferase
MPPKKKLTFSSNPLVEYHSYPEHLQPEIAVELFSQYNVILDCTDTPATRYMISDAAVFSKRPLISASALQTHGQLMVLNNPAEPPGDVGGPCYRCIFKTPPPAEFVTTCGEGGILGPVVGVMGILQALEAIKLLTKENQPQAAPERPTMLIFNALSTQPFRSMVMRPRRAECVVCSSSSSITRHAIESGEVNYPQFCGIVQQELLPDELRISAMEYADLRQTKTPHILLDVREKNSFDIANLPQSLNLPFSLYRSGSKLADEVEVNEKLSKDPNLPIYVICQRGNDSQVITKRLHELNNERGTKGLIKDIRGGYLSWRKEVDNSWPEF